MDDESELLYQEFIKSFIGEQQTSSSTKVDDNDNDSKNNIISLLFNDEEDPNDPEYNVFQDLGNLGTLDFDEFLSFYNENDSNNTNNNQNCEFLKNCDQFIDGNQLISSTQSIQKSSFTDINQLSILYYQSCFLVQSLAQGWLLSLSIADGTIKDKYKQMLFDLNEKNDSNEPNFFSYVQNLLPTLNLINEHGEQIIADELNCNFQINLSKKSKKLFSNRKDIFMFDWALPERKYLKEKKNTNLFTEGIDALIAFGMADHQSKKEEKSLYEHIHKRFLPTHSVRCIIDHVKNLKQNRTNNQPKGLDSKSKYNEWWSNPIIYYLREKKLRPLNLYFTNENLSNIDKLGPVPKWYKQMIAKEEKPLCIVENVKTSNFNEPSTSYSNLKLIKSQPNIQVQKINLLYDDNTAIIQEPNIPVINYIPTLADPKLNQHLEEVRRNTIMMRKKKIQIRNKKRSLAKMASSKSAQILSDAQTQTESHDVIEVIDEVPEQNNDHDSIVEQSNESDKQNQTNNDDQKINCETVENDLFYDDEVDDGDDGQDEDMVDDDDIIYEEHNKLISNEKDDADGDGNVEDSAMDDENDLMALMEASWTTVTNKRNNKTDADGSITARRKSEIMALQSDSSRFILQNDSIFNKKQDESRSELFCNYYLKRARKLLIDNDDYVKFLELIVSFMNNFDSNDDDLSLNRAKKFYNDLKEFLMNIQRKYKNQQELVNKQQIIDGLQELIELLVLFLDLFQAQACDQSFQYLHWTRIFEFFRKVELYLSFIYPKSNQRHSCIQKMVRSLNQLVVQQNQSDSDQKSKLKATVSRILNNHPLLMKEFSSLFLDEPPAQYLYSNDEDFDEFVINDDDVNDNVCEMENAQIPVNELDLKYGTKDCPCLNCHGTMNNETNMAITNHCTLCSIRFISGRIYLPISNNKKLQLVEYIKQPNDPEKSPLQSMDKNQQSKISEPKTKIKWSYSEDRLLLQACRSMIVNSNITKLTEQVIDKVAKNLTKEQLLQQRNVDEISERLHHLIEMLTSS